MFGKHVGLDSQLLHRDVGCGRYYATRYNRFFGTKFYFVFIKYRFVFNNPTQIVVSILLPKRIQFFGFEALSEASIYEFWKKKLADLTEIRRSRWLPRCSWNDVIAKNVKQLHYHHCRIKSNAKNIAVLASRQPLLRSRKPPVSQIGFIAW